ncbi:FAD-dependent oxidoreductase [Curvibacter sp. APW13]|uniref:FAD-dependent oxidoreductase n=1 Tax=Curvibacter sp. APW13 TaxID=3077236 RepID=UPI0028DDC815|nr:FAD-dependent oxidoreductase [Curvibacter sp. APW13]MDT8990536.1 FAD-dependent oxidoreductase [Curvibacter sp. APW13]
MKRRTVLGAGLGVAGLAACGAEGASGAHIEGGFTGIAIERGHALRDGGAPRALPGAKVRRTQVLILGGGVAGLAAARALRLRGVDDFAVLELEDSAGGNARAGRMGGIDCPLGAHYLPLPSDEAPEVQDLLEQLGLRQRVAGRWQYDERHLCHSPQERLFLHGAWQEGLLPWQGVGADTRAQYARFAALVAQAQRAARWTLPVQNRPAAPMQRALAAITFETYLAQHGLDDTYLRWYLDYCCHDDFGAGIATVSAWAGMHYFASRHGFHPGGEAGAEREGVLTWPEGNAWLTQRLAAPLGERLHTARVVLRVESQRHGVAVEALHVPSGTVERWQAEHAIVALPIFVAARVVQNPPDFLRQALQRSAYAPWLVANLQVSAPLHDPPGAAPSWDNVLYGTSTHWGLGLGYVDARHQSLRPVPGPTVLTHYRALGQVAGVGAPVGQAGRLRLAQGRWQDWRDAILAELSIAHPDLGAKTTRLELTRYGHAMAVPVPQPDGQIGLWPAEILREQLSKQKRLRSGGPPRPVLAWQRLCFAHSDWAGYSVFEEAFTAGHAAGLSLG